MRKHTRPFSEILGSILFVSLVLSVVYSCIRFLAAPETIAPGSSAERVRSDYLLMLTQCVLGLIVMALPSLIEKKWKLGIPNFIYILYYLFLYCAVFLGEVFDFYYAVPHWDTMLHFFSGGMLGALGFILIDLLNQNERIRISLSPLFVSLFAFSFALAAGAIWEIYEFTCDSFLRLNMQKYATEEGVLRIGQEALKDTMKDIIFDAIAALIVAVLGYLTNIRQKNKPTLAK